MSTTHPGPATDAEPSIEQLEQEFGITIHRPSPLPPPQPLSQPPQKPKPSWLYAGPTSSFPNLSPQSSSVYLGSPTTLSSPFPCKLFSQTPSSTPSSDSASTSLSQSSPSPSPSPCLTPLDIDDTSTPDSLLIFKYRGNIHAIEPACPHQGYPMSKATVSDIEDFGVMLSAGVTCPKHGWTFDLWTGEADTGRYRLGVWEVEVREDGLGGEGEGQVWVRKKERRRMG